jgi:hypothetical protein
MRFDAREPVKLRSGKIKKRTATAVAVVSTLLEFDDAMNVASRTGSSNPLLP